MLHEETSAAQLENHSSHVRAASGAQSCTVYRGKVTVGH